MRTSWTLAVIVAVVGASTGIARANDKTAAEELFVQAKKLQKAGKTAEACDAFAKSQDLDPQFGTQYNLALCEVDLGKLASAWAVFRELAQRDTNAARKKDSDKRADALEHRITKLLITITGSAPGLTVTRDGVDVTKLVGVQDPVDPGTYHVVATAPGYQDWSTDVAVAGEGAVITVQVPALEKPVATEPVSHPPPPTTTKVPPTVVPTAPVPPAHHHGSTRKLAGLGLVGVGAISAGVGLYFGDVASSDWKKVTDLCPGQTCASSTDLTKAKGLVADTRSAGNLSTILVGAGVVAAAGGVILWLTAPSSHEHADPTALHVVPTHDGLAVLGGF